MRTPCTGPIACDMRKSGAEYKVRTKQKQYAEHNQFTNDLHDAVSDKSLYIMCLPSRGHGMQDLVARSSPRAVYRGGTDHANITEGFRCNFEAASIPDSSIMHEKLQQDQFSCAYNSYYGARKSIEEVANVELVDSMIQSLKRATTAGSDGLGWYYS